MQQNYVNIVTMEASLVYSFCVYRNFVWKDRTTRISRVLFRQLPIYHLSAGVGVLARTLLFPLFQSLGMYYLLNIALGILAGAAINYALIDRYVFKNRVDEEAL